MHCYHNNLLPPLFFNLFFTNNQTHGYNTRTANNYRTHHCRTNLKKFTILYQGPKIWNSLPVQITSLSSFPNFKKKRLEFLKKLDALRAFTRASLRVCVLDAKYKYK